MSLVSQQRRAQHGLTVLLNRDVGKTFDLIDVDNLDQTVPRWVSTTGAVVHSYARTSASLAGAYYLAERKANGLSGRFTVPLADPPPADQMATSLGFAVSGLYGKPALDTVHTVIGGVVQRLVVNAGRETVTTAVREDRKAKGWQRVTSGGCDFCEMLASRGPTYSEESVDFEAHDSCQCFPEPVFG